MRYTAKFEIDCGVSPGFGVKYSDTVDRTETLSADNPAAAYQEAMKMAMRFANDYLSNPETGLTRVQLSSLRDTAGDVPFDPSKAIVRRSMIEHLLLAVARD